MRCFCICRWDEDSRERSPVRFYDRILEDFRFPTARTQNHNMPVRVVCIYIREEISATAQIVDSTGHSIFTVTAEQEIFCQKTNV